MGKRAGQQRRRSWITSVLVFIGLWLVPPRPALAQLNEECTATVLNRTIQVSTNGTFAIGNVPVPPGAFRVRIVCEGEDGVERAQSNFILGVANGVTLLKEITFGVDDPIPVSLEIRSPATVLTPAARGVQLSETVKILTHLICPQCIVQI